MGRWWKLQDVEKAGHGVCALEVPFSVSSHFFICVLPLIHTPLAPSLPPFWLPWADSFALSYILHHDSLHHLRPEAMEIAKCGLIFLKINKSLSSPLSCFSQAFCHSNGKLTTLACSQGRCYWETMGPSGRSLVFMHPKGIMEIDSLILLLPWGQSDFALWYIPCHFHLASASLPEA